MNTLGLILQERAKIGLFIIVVIFISFISLLIISFTGIRNNPETLVIILSQMLLFFALPILFNHFIKMIYNITYSYNYFFWLRKIFLSYLFLYFLTFLIYIIIFRFLQSSGSLGTFNKTEISSRLLFYFYGAILNAIRFLTLFYLIVFKTFWGRNLFSSIPSAINNLFYYNLITPLLKLFIIISALIFINSLFNELRGFYIYLSFLFIPFIFAFLVIDIINIFQNNGLQLAIDKSLNNGS